jgi:predicted transposase/invertase (TIGR01784 family)
MHMLWTDSFKSRVLFNAAKAFVRQLHKGVDYKGLKPVYALSIVNDIFEPKIETFYHHYKFVHNIDSSKILEGLQLIFVELPKFKAKAFNDKKISLLWLCFLKEIQKGNDMLNEDLIKELQTVPEIAEALELTKESAYTPAQLEVYDKYWDNISIEKTFIVDAEAKGKIEGLTEGEIIGEQKNKVLTIINGDKMGLSIKNLSELTGLTEDQIKNILNKK